MTQIVVDATLSAQLNQLSQPVMFCDPAGRALGKFFPTVNLEEWEPLSPGVSEEELDRREKANEKRYTTAQVLAHLEKL